MMLTQLAAVAKRTGYPVVEVPGWRTRGRPGGMDEIRTITCHHTANGGARGDYPSLDTVRDGRPGLPGPLAQLGLGVSGTIYVIAAGKCNHAGESLRPEYLNGHAIGIEAEAIGLPGAKSDWPEPQMDSYARLCAALIDEFGLVVADVRGHKETCAPPRRKSDPSFEMASFRRRVAVVDLKIKPTQEDDMAEPSDWKHHKLTEADAKAMGDPDREGESVSWDALLRFPPAVTLTRRELASLRSELAAQHNAVVPVLAAQASALSQILATLKDIAARLPDTPAAG